MKLLYDLKDEYKKALCLKDNERIRYCVPFDLMYDFEEGLAKEEYTDGKAYLVVTDYRMIVLSGAKVLKAFVLSECKEIKCETQVHCGVVVVTDDEGKHMAARFSLRHITRVAYVARGADILVQGINEQIESHEYEMYCEKCGRAMPGTSKCPYCDGKAVVLKKFWKLCKGYQWKLLAISCFMVLASGISILMPDIQQNFIDNVLMNKTGDYTDIAKFVLTMLGLTAALIIINVVRNWWCVSLGAMLSMDLREMLYHKIQILSISFINKRKPGELMNRVSRDTAQIRRFMEEIFGSMISTIVTMIASLIMMLTLDAKMTFYSTAMIICAIVITRLFWKSINKIFHKQWLRDDEMRSGLQDVISGMRVVKAFGKEEAESAKFERLSQNFARMQVKNETFWAVFFPILMFIMSAGSYIAIYFGGREVLAGDMSVGELMQFVTYTGYLFGPLAWMTHLPRSVVQMITSLNRIYDVLDEEPELKDGEEAKAIEIKGDIKFDDVSFGYNSYEPVVEHISFDVKAGEMIGLVGASGTGKSTIINLIMRLYDVNRGSISIDGIDIRDIEQTSLHSQLGVVLQETFLFSGTILNNLRFVKADATNEEIIRACKAANAHDFICKMPDGYNTYVGEHGYNLSGGERQRIAIARAILNNPRLLILDEATSALDTESEFLIQQALERLTEGKTTFAIAHRLSTLRNADRLIVIDGHKIAEIGTHNELLEKKGIYYGLVTAQLEMAAGKESDENVIS